MATIKIERKHSLENSRLRTEVQNLADKLASELDARYHWQGDRLEFERSGAKGYIGLGEDNLQIEITLGMFLAPFKAKVERTINDYLDQHLV